MRFVKATLTLLNWFHISLDVVFSRISISSLSLWEAARSLWECRMLSSVNLLHESGRESLTEGREWCKICFFEHTFSDERQYWSKTLVHTEIYNYYLMDFHDRFMVPIGNLMALVISQLSSVVHICGFEKCSVSLFSNILPWNLVHTLMSHWVWIVITLVSSNFQYQTFNLSNTSVYDQIASQT